MKARKRPVEVEFWKIGTPAKDTPLWVFEAFLAGKMCTGFRDAAMTTPVLQVYTLEGPMHAATGDYLVRGVEGELYPVKASVFEKTYELVESAHETVERIRSLAASANERDETLDRRALRAAVNQAAQELSR